MEQCGDDKILDPFASKSTLCIIKESCLTMTVAVVFDQALEQGKSRLHNLDKTDINPPPFMIASRTKSLGNRSVSYISQRSGSRGQTDHTP